MTTRIASPELSVDSPQVRRAMARSALYRFFSAGCGYPTDERDRMLREDALPAARAAAFIAARKMIPNLGCLARHLDSSAVDEMQAQYHLAIGHLPLPDCPPYEAGYLGGAQFREENILADIGGFYRAFGLRLGRNEAERPDHVTVQLEFMRVLTFREAYARAHHGPAEVRICRHAQRRFWRDHLGRWLASFGVLLATRSPRSFYGELGSSLQEFAEAESRTLGKAELAREPRIDEPLPFGEMECSVGTDECPLLLAQDGQESSRGSSR
jgi:DMSO reductase family type II enzyme chaperone